MAKPDNSSLKMNELLYKVHILDTMIHIIEPRPLGYCPARNVSTMLVHQVHVISRHITATDIVSTILAITEIRSAFHQTMSITLYQLGHDFIDKNLSQPTSLSLCLCQCAILVNILYIWLLCIDSNTFGNVVGGTWCPVRFTSFGVFKQWYI